MIKKILLLVILLTASYLLYLNSQTPRTDREWNDDQALPAEVIFDGYEVTVKNVRNFTYRSVSDYAPGYYDTEFNLNDVETVDYIVEPFGSIGAAHTFLSFGFKNGKYLAISVEIRKEVGEVFSPWLGLLNQYEMMYVIADERDVIGLRANYRKHDVYLYPTVATPDQAKLLLTNMLRRSNKLLVEPEFYNTVTSNCTTNIAKHINEITAGKVGYDLRLLLPENSDVLAMSLGLLAIDTDIESARAKYRINDRAEKYDGQEDFSTLIRQVDVSLEPSVDTYQVSRVIDGDTIEVISDAGVKEIVRYIGIDTPEIAGPNTEAECLGNEASAYNRELVLGKRVRLVKDVSEVDKYDRLLRYVYVGDTQVNENLVTEGYAEAKTYPPDTKFRELLNMAQNQAKNNKRGLWSGVCTS